MAYEGTDVPISRSQEGIRTLVSRHQGTGISFMSHPPKEGFEALVTIQEHCYHIRVTAECKDVSRRRDGKLRTFADYRTAQDAEQRRVWRVLFFHLKALFEAADSGVIAVEDVILPYIVMSDNRTISEHIAPKLAEVRAMTPEKLLTTGGFR